MIPGLVIFPLIGCNTYPDLYAFCIDKQATIEQCLDAEDNWEIAFCRSFTEQEMRTWDRFTHDLLSHPGEHRDVVSWGLEKNGLYTTRSLYRFLTNGGVISQAAKSTWECKLPMKIKVFLWQFYHGKLQASAVLKRKVWKGDQCCVLCRNIETINHIFFACSFGRFVWCRIRDALGWEGFPTSVSDLMGRWIQNTTHTHKSLDLFFLAGFMWAIWRARNKMTIEKKFPNNPTKVLRTELYLSCQGSLWWN